MGGPRTMPSIVDRRTSGTEDASGSASALATRLRNVSSIANLVGLGTVGHIGAGLSWKLPVCPSPGKTPQRQGVQV
eukprot:8570296-Pyramimonas_sp.AAC.1